MSSSKKDKKSKTQTAARRGGNEGGISWGQVAAIGAAGIATGVLLYVKTGAGSEKNAALIPDAIEDPIDKIVDALNREVGRNWGNFALSVLEKTLENALPPEIVALVKVIHKAELLAKENLIKPSDKKAWTQSRIDKKRLN